MEGKNKKYQIQFAVLWSGQAASMLTSAVLQMAIVWYLTEKTGSAAVLSLATVMGFLPQAVLGIFIGALIDRYDRKKVLIYSDLFIALMGLVLFVVGLFGEIPIWLIMVVLFVRSVGSAFYSPSLNAVMPLIVPKEQLTRFAGYAQSFRSVSMLLSPALAAVLFSWWDLNVIVLLDVAGALLAVTAFCRVAIPKVTREQTQAKPNLLLEVRQGLAALREQKGLVPLVVISAVYAALYSPIGTLFPHITMVYFGGTVAQSSAVEIVFACGMLAGSLLLGRIGWRIDKMRAISCSIALYGFSVLATGLLPPQGLRFFFVFAALIGLANPFFNGVQVAVLQTKVKEEYLGRVLSLTSSAGMLAMPLGLSLSGLFTDKIGVNHWYAGTGAVILVLAVVSRCIPSMRHCCDEE